MLAATDSAVAFSSGRNIQLAAYRLVQARVYKGFSRPSVWLTIAFLGLLSPVAMRMFRRPLRKLLRWLLRLPEAADDPARKPEDPSLPDFLIEACLNGDCVLYAGAGLSAQAGLPLWDAAVREMIDWASRDGLLSVDAAARAMAEIERGSTGSAASRLAEGLDGHEPALHAYLRRRYWVTGELPEAHQLIRQIDFPALVTTTFDNLLDRTFPQSGGRVYTARDCYSIENAAARRDFLLLKPFGDPDEPGTIRLGPVQCRDVMDSNPACLYLLDQLLHLRTMLFVGASLEGIESDLGHIPAGGPIAKKHFALVADNGNVPDEAIERLLKRYNIQVVTYTPSDPSHPELPRFLKRLLGAMREKRAVEIEFDEDEALHARRSRRATA